ncbi:MAG: phosphoglucomutase/phosphomannomutase family protein [Bacteroidetes bacterium]|nr:phosphoglucomutase/phosphomannomutase family protein [Bacteroidota bacterium]MCW5894678.1 phosphoglucomutase/phosphomannomutase family protein [Bacteroidota bacterium]
MPQPIKFGTDGWRAVIGDDYTFANLEKVALATARHYKKHKKIRNGIVIGYDARFMSKEFAEVVATTIANTGIKVKLSDSIASTPAISLLSKTEKAAAGIVITASHNPYKWNGFKIKGEFGGPAFPETIDKVEKELAKILKPKKLPPQKRSFKQLLDKGTISTISMKQQYLDDLMTKLNFDLIKNSGIRILYDVMHGAGQGVLDGVLPNVVQMRNEYNPSFGGTNPEPITQNLGTLMRRVKDEGFHIGIATDGDADRIGAVDEHGNFVDSQRVFALLLKYLVEERGLRGDVVKTFSVTQMVDKQCEKYGLAMRETPIGFKHVCRLMVEGDVLIGGEESGGLGTKVHLPERDGIFLGLLLCEMMAVRQKSLSYLVQELMDEYGQHEFKRIDHHTTEQGKAAIMRRFKKGVKKIAGYNVIDRQDKDGFKFFVEGGGWVLVRASGTEPLIRFYAESDSQIKCDALLAASISG